MRHLPPLPPGSHPTLAAALLALASLAACGGGGAPTSAVDNDVDDASQAPEVASVEPEVLDRDEGGTLTIRGARLGGDLALVLVDARGDPLAEPAALRARPGGQEAEAQPRPGAGAGAEVEAEVRLRGPGGREIRTGRRVRLVREYRSLDGAGNDRAAPDEGRADTPLRRMAPAAYGDGLASLARADGPGPRAVSNAVVAQPELRPNARGASDMLWQWGQFLDHDLDLSVGAEPAESVPIPVPAGDPLFDPLGRGDVVMPFTRSAYVAGRSPREQVNALTAWIDASQVYGSDEARARALRTLDGTGRLKTSAGDLLPFNEAGLPNAGGPDPTLFVAGDIRVNEQVGLAAMHTLWVREHNRQAARLAAAHPELDDEALYQEARRRVGALMQVITYREFLPIVLGPDALGAYRGYRPEVDASIANEFSSASFRFGHSLLSPVLLRLDADGRAHAAGHLALTDAFFQVGRLVTEGGIEPVLRGLCAQPAQELDAHIVEEVRSFLFGPPGAGGLDLAALNLQRGRDHGLASYNDLRRAYGLAPRTTFAEVTSDAHVAARLASVYGDVERIDPWLGGLAEDHVPGAMVGELIRAVLADQFQRLRDGDRFWYQRAFHGAELAELEATRLADVIRRASSVGAELADEAFLAPRPSVEPPR